MARTCAFCGDSKLSKEHLWPSWLQHMTGDITEPFPHQHTTEVDGQASRDHSWPQPPFDLQVRAVCAACNNGWMSDLEQAVKPVLQPMLECRGKFLHRREQRQLASWALLKAIMFDYTHPETPAVPQPMAAHLYEQREPAPRTWVWLAACTAERPGSYTYQGMQLTPPGATEAPGQATAFTATLTIGPVVVLVAGSVLEGFDLDGVTFPSVDTTRIWPYRGPVDHNPRELLTTEGVEQFAAAIANDLHARSRPV